MDFGEPIVSAWANGVENKLVRRDLVISTRPY